MRRRLANKPPPPFSFVFVVTAPVFGGGVPEFAAVVRRTAARTPARFFLWRRQAVRLCDYHVFAYPHHGRKRYVYVLPREAEALAAGHIQAAYPSAREIKYQVAHPAEVFAVCNAYHVHLLYLIIRKFHYSLPKRRMARISFYAAIKFFVTAIGRFKKFCK